MKSAILLCHPVPVTNSHIPATRRLWRAVDQDGYVLDEIVHGRRDTKAAKRLLTRLMKK